MTASNAGDPAMDPGDARPDATGPDILDPVTVRMAQPGPSGRPRTGGDAAVGAHEGDADSGIADLGQAGPDRAGGGLALFQAIGAARGRLRRKFLHQGCLVDPAAWGRVERDS